MRKIMVLGAGNIGSLIGCLLADAGDYTVYLCDMKKPDMGVEMQQLTQLVMLQLDVSNTQEMERLCRENGIQVIISCLPYYCGLLAAELAKTLEIHYFDLTEDILVAEQIKKLAMGSSAAFVPRCGLAPGFVNILANDLIGNFTRLDSVELRVGNLPMNVNNALQYALSWSTDGLINEYGNTCYGIVEGQKMPLQPLEDLEVVEIDGHTYEAFNTSGGAGSLVDTCEGKVRNLNYKTLRYPGHCAKMHFLMKELRLNDDRQTLKKIIESVLPKTAQDVALIYVAITGIKNQQLINESYVNKIYPKKFLNRQWAAIQITTASALCAVVDIVVNNVDKYHGLVLQEQFALPDFLHNRFGAMFRKGDLEVSGAELP